MKTLTYTILILFLVGTIAGIAYGFGFRLYEGRIVEAGSVAVVLPSERGVLFFDEERVSRDSDELVISFARVSPGEHTLIYAEDEAFPWQRTFMLEPEEELTFSPFVSPTNLSGFFVGSADEEYPTIQEAFLSDGTEGETGAVLSEDGTTALWTIGNTLFLEWRGDEADIPHIFCGETVSVCDTRLLFFEGEMPITHAAFYKDQRDVVLVASGDTVFAIDAFIDDYRNFQPIFNGTDVDFRKKNSEELYVSDKGGEQFLIVRY